MKSDDLLSSLYIYSLYTAQLVLSLNIIVEYHTASNKRKKRKQSRNKEGSEGALNIFVKRQKKREYNNNKGRKNLLCGRLGSKWLHNNGGGRIQNGSSILYRDDGSVYFNSWMRKAVNRFCFKHLHL